jgi:hypothetical protein
MDESKADTCNARKLDFFLPKGSPEARARALKASAAAALKRSAQKAEREAAAVEAHERQAGRWTVTSQTAFLSDLAENGNAVAAARRVGLSVNGAYALKTRNQSFAARWAEARDLYADAAEARATEMALNGVVEEVIHKGEVRTSRRYSDRLLSDVLTRRRPGAAAEVKAAAANARLPGVAGEQGRLVLEARLAALEAKKAEIGK